MATFCSKVVGPETIAADVLALTETPVDCITEGVQSRRSGGFEKVESIDRETLGEQRQRVHVSRLDPGLFWRVPDRVGSTPYNIPPHRDFILIPGMEADPSRISQFALIFE